MFDAAIVEHTRSTRIEDELARRGIKLRGGVDRCGPCPQCGGHDRFSINLKKQVFNCRGCSAGGDVIALVRHLDGLSFKGAIETLYGVEANYSNVHTKASNATNTKNSDDAKRTEAALAIWQSAVPADGTPVATYLASRGLHVPPSAMLRFHAGLKHPCGGIWPAMVALVMRGGDDSPLAIHRTFLARDGIGKAPVDPQKMMLGPCRGGAVRLASPGDVLMVGEGIESCLAAMLATGNPAWAALSTSGLRTLDLPDAVRDVIVLADGDDPGEAAASDCAWRWKREGRHVRIARPPPKMDFNDLLLGRADRIEESGL